MVNPKILMNKMCLEFRFYICCANFITIGEPPIVLYIYIYMKNIIVIISKNKSKIEKFSRTKCRRIQFYISCTNFIRIDEQIRDVIVTSRDAVTSL